EGLLHSLNQAPPVFLRANLLKATAQVVSDELSALGYPNKVLSEESLVLVERKNVFVSETFRKGFFEIQDLNSQRVVQVLDPRPGDFVIDACAGAGGKTLHIAARMKNKGRLLGLDVQEKKLAE